MDIKKVLEKSRMVSYLAGAGLMALVGVVFMMLSDLAVKNTATLLMLAVALSFGGAIAAFFSETLREKPIFLFILKVLALALTVGFIIYLYEFRNNEVFIAAGKMKPFVMIIGNKEKEISRTVMMNFMMTSSLVLTYVAAGCQAINIGLNAFLGVKE